MPRDRKALLDVWLIADRTVTPPGTSAPSAKLPFAVSNDFRRVSQRLIDRKKIKVRVAPNRDDGDVP